MNPTEFYARMTAGPLGLIVSLLILYKLDDPQRWYSHPYLLTGLGAVLLPNLFNLLRVFSKDAYFRLESHESENVAASK